VLSVIGALLAIAQMIIAGFGAEESYDYRTYFLDDLDGDCTSFICDEVIIIDGTSPFKANSITLSWSQTGPRLVAELSQTC